LRGHIPRSLALKKKSCLSVSEFFSFSKQAADGSQKQQESGVSAKQRSLRNLNYLFSKVSHGTFALNESSVNLLILPSAAKV
jgi:hypothetical protein